MMNKENILEGADESKKFPIKKSSWISKKIAKLDFSRKNWKLILIEIYLYAPETYKFIDCNKKSHELAKKLKIEGSVLKSNLTYLIESGLIESKSLKEHSHMIQHFKMEDIGDEIVLTKKGFEVAFDFEKHRENALMQFGIVLFTGMLILTSLLEIFYPISDEKTKMELLYVFIFLTIAFAGLGIYASKKN